MIRVTYLSHSGFLVEMDDACFLFDYYKGEIPDIDREKQLFVFVSHGHYDHYKKEIFRLAEREKETYYILPEEIKIPKEPKVKLSEDRLILTVPGGEYEAAGCKIRTLRSTDEGVAYLVSYRGKRIYHAGDLNWWHWRKRKSRSTE
uniref:MBL fold metallo-hydrolase n=1 Tax=Mediterraneibacter glycyrrhizinilyticus TaxID=342942 RepID=UPI000ABCEFA9